MTSFKVSLAGKWMAIVAAVSGGLLLAAAIRYGILENETQEMMCRQGGNGWCSLRASLGWSIYHQLFGLAGLFLGMAAWLPRMRWAAYPGLLLAGCGLFIYNATYAAVAVIVALLAVLRPVSSTR